jgi:hypothetical protein
MFQSDDAGMVPMIGKADALLITAGAGMSVDVAQGAGV